MHGMVGLFTHFGAWHHVAGMERREPWKRLSWKREKPSASFFFSFTLAENILVFDVAAIAAAVLWLFFSENRKKATAHASALPYIA